MIYDDDVKSSEQSDGESTIFDDTGPGDIFEKREKNGFDAFPFKFMPVLMIMEGVNVGSNYALPCGRDENADFTIPDTKISRRHCLFEIRRDQDSPEGYVALIKDLNSKNGTFLNERKIKNTNILSDGDAILVGSTLLGFFLKSRDEMFLENRLFKMATGDFLTGLYNRSYFDSAVESEFKRFKRYEHPFSLIIMDLDHFKKVNDNFGHAAGDVVLKQVGAILHDSIRSHDIAARYGGEEFGVVLTETPSEEAGIVAERIRGKIEKHIFTGTNFSLNLTASLGVASTNREVGGGKDIVKHADAALYEAKEAGRNCIRIFDDSSQYSGNGG